MSQTASLGLLRHARIDKTKIRANIAPCQPLSILFRFFSRNGMIWDRHRSFSLALFLARKLNFGVLFFPFSFVVG